MLYKDVKVNPNVMFNARYAFFFCQKAAEYSSAVWIEFNVSRVNAKSFLGVFSLHIHGGDEVRIYADGQDEEDAVKDMCEFVRLAFE